MYEDVLDDSALEAMWAEHPEAFQVGELRERIDELEAKLAEATAKDPISSTIASDDYVCVCPMLGRACIEDYCAWYLDYGRNNEGCALAWLAESHRNVQISTHNIASCM